MSMAQLKAYAENRTASGLPQEKPLAILPFILFFLLKKAEDCIL
jgi:hypothetical protein